MTRAVADLAVAAQDPGRLKRVEERAGNRRGALRMAVAIAVEDAVRRRGDRRSEDLCSMCVAECPDRSAPTLA